MMPLVDYSSDSESDAAAGGTAGKTEAAVTDGSNAGGEPPTKRRRTNSVQVSHPAKDALPPLPAAFHDLYAATVRVSNVDDPSLHQGRRRVIPHVVGNWPTHVYIEWHPTPEDHDVLTALVAALKKALETDENEARKHSDIKLFSFLTSDLGAPQPLHVSLSRPLALATGNKDIFLERVIASIAGTTSGSVRPFTLRPTALVWHRSPDSDRTFLVLRVESCLTDDGPMTAVAKATATWGHNQQLTTLLTRCNAIAKEFGQPALYEIGGESPPPAKSVEGRRTARQCEFGSQARPKLPSSRLEASAATQLAQAVDASAFHISVAWTFAVPDAELVRRTDEVFRRHQGRLLLRARTDETEVSLTRAVGNRHDDYGSSKDEEGNGKVAEQGQSFEDAVTRMRIPVDAVKVKIGNVVSHVALPGRRGSGVVGGGIVGLR